MQNFIPFSMHNYSAYNIVYKQVFYCQAPSMCLQLLSPAGKSIFSFSKSSWWLQASYFSLLSQSIILLQSASLAYRSHSRCLPRVGLSEVWIFPLKLFNFSLFVLVLPFGDTKVHSLVEEITQNDCPFFPRSRREERDWSKSSWKMTWVNHFFKKALFSKETRPVFSI